MKICFHTHLHQSQSRFEPFDALIFYFLILIEYCALLLLLYLFLLIECGNYGSVLVCDLGLNFCEYRLLVCDSICSFKLHLNTHMIFGRFCYVYTSIYKSRDLMLENIRLCHMAHSL